MKTSSSPLSLVPSPARHPHMQEHAWKGHRLWTLRCQGSLCTLGATQLASGKPRGRGGWLTIFTHCWWSAVDYGGWWSLHRSSVVTICHHLLSMMVVGCGYGCQLLVSVFCCQLLSVNCHHHQLSVMVVAVA